MNLVKIGIVGVGNMGKKHCRVISLLKNVQFIGVYDIDENRCKEIALLYNVTPFKSYNEMLSTVDAVIIAVPTTLHYSCTEEAIQRNKHIFIEKPLVSSLHEAENILQLYKQKNNCIIQVGHIERFNPAIELLNNFIDHSNIISVEARRLSETDRNLDVDVILDLMIHDIDIILNLVKNDLQSVTAIGAYPNKSSINPDIAYALLTFQNGVIANLVANRMSKESLRTVSVTEKNRVLTANYLTKELQIFGKAIADTVPAHPIENSIDTLKVPPTEPLQSEIQHFIHSILNKKHPDIGPQEATKALTVALLIKDSIRTGKTIVIP